MANVLDATGGNALKGTQLEQRKKDQELIDQIAVQNLPPIPEPEVPEEESLFDDADTFVSAEDTENESLFDDAEQWMSEEDLENKQLFGEEEPVEEPLVLEDPEDSEVYQPQSYQEFVQAKQEKGTEIDYLGFIDNSLVTHAGQWALQVLDDEYVPENSIKGREQAIALIDEQIIQNDRPEVLDMLWDKKYGLQYQNSLDLAAADSEFDLKEIAQSIADRPGEFGKQILQEMINKPELIIVPWLLAAKTTVAVASAAKAMQVTGAAANVAKIVAGTGAAYTGGVTIGTIDRAVSRKGMGIDSDLLGDFERAQMDGVLGVVFAGGGMAVSSTISRAAGRKSAKTQALNARVDEYRSALAGRDVALDTTIIPPTNSRNQLTEINFARAAAAQARKDAGYTEVKGINDYFNEVHNVEYTPDEISAAFDPTSGNAMVDGRGNVYNVQIDKTLPQGSYSAMFDEANTQLDQAQLTTTQIKEIKSEIETLRNEQSDLFDNPTSTHVELNAVGDLIEIQENKLTSLHQALDVAESVGKWDTIGPESQKYINGQTSEGAYTFKMLEKKDLERGMAAVTGLEGISFSLPSSSTKPHNWGMQVIREYGGSALSNLRRIGKSSPTMQAMINMVEVSTENPTLPIYSIHENTINGQAQFLGQLEQATTPVTAKGLFKGKENLAVEEALRKHMRGVEESTDPRVLEAATGIRKVLDDVRAYAKENGVHIGTIRDYLPRHYVRDAFDDPARSERFITNIMEHEGYDRTRALQVLEEIQKDLEQKGDVVYSRGGDTQPSTAVGDRTMQHIPDYLLDEVMTDKFIGSINKYVMNTVKRVEMEKVFGAGGSNLKKITKDASDEYFANTGERIPEADLDRIDDIYNLLQGTYAKPVSARGKQVTDAVITFETVGHLDLVTWASALEPLTMAFALKESNLLTSVVPIMKTFFAGAGGRKAMMKLGYDTDFATRVKEAKEMGLLMGVATRERVEQLTAEGLSGWPKKINQKFIQGVGLHAWTENTRAVAYEASWKDSMRTIQRLVEDPNKNIETRRRWLQEKNIDPDKAKKWYAEGSDHNDPFYQTIKRGSVRQVNNMIANPNALNKAKWTTSSAPILRLASLFKTFGQVFNKDVMRPGMREVEQLWNEGNKTKALEKMGSMITVVSAMAYFTGYKNDMLEEALGGESSNASEEEIAATMGKNVVSLLVPGASLVTSTLGSNSPIEAMMGPVASDVKKFVSDPAGFLPSKVPIVKRIPEFKEATK